MKYIDLRSDTVTQPTLAMRDAMYRAKVGDDVFDDDPTIKDLEEFAAKLLGKEAALFVTSGTQGNACCIMAQTRRGDCIIIDPKSHIADHEAGSYAQLSGVSLRFPQSSLGTMNPESVAECITDDSDILTSPTGLIVVENAHSTGAVVPLENMKAIYEIAQEHHVPVHLDGARLFNAAHALGIQDIREMTQYCDTLNCCLSKGLCAPVGSIIAGPADVIHRAKKARKILGGGMRQAGFLAAAGKLALTEMTKRMGEDHENALYLAEKLEELPGIHVFLERLDANLLFFTTDWEKDEIAQYPHYMLSRGIKVTGLMGNEFRIVTHYGVSREDCDIVLEAIRTYVAEVLPS